MQWRLLPLILLILGLLSGCWERTRYFCQSPENWDKPRCQRPQCAVSGTCPDQLLKAEDMKEQK